MERIADYELVGSLGPSGRGDYYLAKTPGRAPVSTEHVAVKVISDAREDAFHRATRELNAFASVRSPYLVTLYDAGQENGVFYYATDYHPAGSLRDIAVPIQDRSALTALAHAARAAQALHDAGLVHRDIGPGNVLFTEDGGKLSDLDLALQMSPDSGDAGMPAITSVEFTDRGLLSGGEPGPVSDVWSLGETLHWITAGAGLYGRLPTDDPVLTLRMVLSRQPRIADELDADVADLVHACVGDAAGRPTAGEVADRLKVLARG